MADIKITIDGGAQKRLMTAGKYCDRDILVTATGGGGDVPPYTGSYTVTPSPEEQVLQTAGMQMTDDVTVREIPVYITENDANGNTIYIGGN